VRERERLRRLFRAAHAIGAAGLLALAAAMTFSLPTRADTLVETHAAIAASCMVTDARGAFSEPQTQGAIFTTFLDRRATR